MQPGAPISKRKLQVRVCKMLRFRRTGLHTEPMTGDNPVDLTILEEPMPANYYHGATDGMPTADAGNLSDLVSSRRQNLG